MRGSLLCVLVAVAALARAAPASEPFSGDERIFVETALVPIGTLRSDLNGARIPGGFKLGWWANLSSASALDGRARVVTSFRLDVDTAATAAETAAFPFLSQQRFSVLSAYVEYDATRSVAIRAGRQFQADLADWLAFDGARVTWRLPSPSVRLELYAGARTTLGIPQGTISSALYELDGVASVEGPQPLAGATLRWSGEPISRREASIGYRRSWRAGTGDQLLDSALPDGPYVTAEELVGGASGDVGRVHLAAGAAVELALVRLMRARVAASVDHAALFEGSGVDATYGVELQRVRPTFALDSIWNFFSTNPYDEATATAVWRASDLARLEARAWMRLFQTDGSAASGGALPDSPGIEPAGGARLGTVRRYGGLLADVFVGAQGGYGGRRLLVDSGLTLPLGESLTGYTRLTLLEYAHDSVSIAGSALGIVAGATWRLPGGASASVVLEENLSARASPVPRLYGLVDFARWL